MFKNYFIIIVTGWEGIIVLLYPPHIFNLFIFHIFYFMTTYFMSLLYYNILYIKKYNLLSKYLNLNLKWNNNYKLKCKVIKI